MRVGVSKASNEAIGHERFSLERHFFPDDLSLMNDDDGSFIHRVNKFTSMSVARNLISTLPEKGPNWRLSTEQAPRADARHGWPWSRGRRGCARCPQRREE